MVNENGASTDTALEETLEKEFPRVMKLSSAPVHEYVCDGKTRLVYCTVGKGAAPVLFIHGQPGCGKMLLMPPEECDRIGVTMVLVDRPGYGHTPWRGKFSVQEVANDYLGLMSHLGYDKFAVIAWSMGGLYVPCLMKAAPERLTKVALLACVFPLYTPDGKAVQRRTMSASARFVMWLMTALPECITVPLNASVMGNPAKAAAEWKSSCSTRAEDYLYTHHREYCNEYIGQSCAGSAQGAAKASVLELRLASRTWPVLPNHVAQLGVFDSNRVRLFHGHSDKEVPADCSSHLAKLYGLDPAEAVCFMDECSHTTVLWPDPFGQLTTIMEWIRG